MVNQNSFTYEQAEPPQIRRRSNPSPAEALEFSAGRVRDVAALRGLGFSYREIASHYGVTPQAISILLSRSRRHMKAIGGNPEMVKLSTRASSALRRLGIANREEAMNAQILSKLAHARNCGRKTLEEIERWMADETAHQV